MEELCAIVSNDLFKIGNQLTVGASKMYRYITRQKLNHEIWSWIAFAIEDLRADYGNQ